MTALYVLIPVAVGIVAVAIWVFFWAVDNGQFDDLDSPAHSILFDDEPKDGKPGDATRPASDAAPKDDPEEPGPRG